ncbi:MAG: hypothetical protein J6A78_02910 [Clostridia bacterium]|nr:hypothetical protein [Clostridia bacterium]
MKKALSVILCINIIMMILPIKTFVVTADESILSQEQTDIVLGIITEPSTNKVGVNVRADADSISNKICVLSDGTSVIVNGSKEDISGQININTNRIYIWYNITFVSGEVTHTGYVREDLITVTNHTITPPDNNEKEIFIKPFEEQLAEFPESYHSYLTALHEQYPNWVFAADNINLTYQEAIALENIFPRKLVGSQYYSWRSMDSGAYNWNTSSYVVTDGRWYAASREVIAYYMDPRNFLNTNDAYIFMKQSYDASSQSIAGIRELLKGRFMANNYVDANDMVYGGDFALVIMEAARQSGVNPYILASTIIQEQGTYGSVFSNGTLTYNGVTVYNFFNFGVNGATESEKRANGARYAYNAGWTTRSAAIIGGALKYAKPYTSYINNDLDNPYYNQDTYFYMDYNILNPSKTYHQYAQNVADQVSSSAILRKLYTGNVTTHLTFRIPVYKDNSLPDIPVSLPKETAKQNNYYFNKIEVTGLTPTFSRYTYDYTLSVNQDTNIHVEVPDTAYYFAANSFDLSVGENTISLTALSETGYTNNYLINITATAACKLTITPNQAHIEHIYDNNCDVDCNICHYKREITHTYLGICDSSCEICNFERDNTKAHSYDGSCDNYCNICNFFENRGEHTYDNACDTNCNICQAQRKVPDHIYDNACDTNCNVCQFIREVPDHVLTLNSNHTCEICKYSKTPDKPILESKTNNSVTLVKSEGFEYSINGSDWQLSNIFTNLSPSTTYTFYQRVQESALALVSDVSEGMSVTFKAWQQIPPAIIVSSFTDTTITLIPLSGCEYSIDGISWNLNNIFTGLSPATKYVLYQRYFETKTHEASNISIGVTVTTDKSKQTRIPAAPTLQNFTANSITLTLVDGCEYSKDGGVTWQTSNIFDDLECGTEYTFHQRYKETDITYVGKSSPSLTAKTDKGTQFAPSAPTLKTQTYNSVTLVKTEGCEYSINGSTWQTSNVFTGLKNATDYIFYQRKAETDRYYASSISPSLSVRTDNVPKALESTGNFTVTTNTVSKINVGTTTEELLGGLTGGEFCKVYKDGQEISGDVVIGTGTVVKILDGDTVKAEYTVIVTGDTNGDGNITITDMIAIKAHVLEKTLLSGVYAIAADTSGDDKISITDFIQVKSKILGKSEIVAR